MKIDKLSNSSSVKLYDLNIPGSFVREFEEYTSLSPMLSAKILGISKSKYYQIASEQKALDIKLVDILSSFLKLWDKGLHTFEGDRSKFQDFLNASNSNLGAVKPINIIDTETGRNEIEKALDRIEHGIYG